MPATAGITAPNDPRIAQRDAVMTRLDRGEITVGDAATEMGVSATWVRQQVVSTGEAADLQYS